ISLAASSDCSCLTLFTFSTVWSGSSQRSPDSPRSPYESATTRASPPRDVATAIAPAARHTKSPECAPTITSFLPPLPASPICSAFLSPASSNAPKDHWHTMITYLRFDFAESPLQHQLGSFVAGP